jgi:hypothetical protein
MDLTLLVSCLALLYTLLHTTSAASYYFITYGDQKYTNSKARIAKEAKESGMFTHVLTFGTS